MRFNFLKPVSEIDDISQTKKSSDKTIMQIEEDDESKKTKKVVTEEIVQVNGAFYTGADKNKVFTKAKDCHNDCSGRGMCLNSTCFCDQGYTYYDCSLTIKEFTLMGYKFNDMVFVLILVFIGAVLITLLVILLRKNKNTNDFLDLEDQ